MNTIWAVYCGDKAKEEFDNDDYICFFEDEKESALKLADQVGEEVEEWAVPRRDFCELRFRREDQII